MISSKSCIGILTLQISLKRASEWKPNSKCEEGSNASLSAMSIITIHDSITFYTICTWISGCRGVHLSFCSSAWFDRSPRRRRTRCSTLLYVHVAVNAEHQPSRCTRPSDQQITLNTNNHITLSADLYTTLFERPPLL